jgi:ankyrin repeat protein
VHCLASPKPHFQHFVEIVEMLLTAGADVNTVCQERSTPLKLVLNRGEYWKLTGNKTVRILLMEAFDTVIVRLLEAVADPDTTNRKGWSAVHLAAANGVENVVKVLLEKGADVRVTQPYGWSILHWPAGMGFVKIVEILLEAGADVKMRDVHGWTALDYAAHRGYDEIVEILLKYMADTGEEDCQKALNIAAHKGHHGVVARLLEYYGVDINCKGIENDWTALHFAARDGDQRLAQLLLQGGAQVSTSDKKGLTPLHIAAEKGFRQIVDMFIKASATGPLS